MTVPPRHMQLVPAATTESTPRTAPVEAVAATHAPLAPVTGAALHTLTQSPVLQAIELPRGAGLAMGAIRLQAFLEERGVADHPTLVIVSGPRRVAMTVLNHLAAPTMAAATDPHPITDVALSRAKGPRPAAWDLLRSHPITGLTLVYAGDAAIAFAEASSLADLGVRVLHVQIAASRMLAPRAVHAAADAADDELQLVRLKHGVVQATLLRLNRWYARRTVAKRRRKHMAVSQAALFADLAALRRAWAVEHAE